MKRPWIPLYVADYLADTAHLRALESGAYLHLIMHYWQHEGLPNDDRKLASIAKLTPAEWRQHRETIAEFFDAGWRHKRIDKELAKASDISCKRSASAKQRRSNGHAIDGAIAEQLHTHARASSQSQSHSEAKASAPIDLEKQLFERGKIVLGKNSGGLITNLIKAKGSIELARAAVETAATKANPREYVGACVRGENSDAVERGDAW